MDVRFDFSDIDKFFEDGKTEIKEVMRQVGEETIQDAINSGTYQDRTGKLRKSNEYEVLDDGLGLANTAEYASFVESKGFRVLASEVIEAERKLKNRIK